MSVSDKVANRLSSSSHDLANTDLGDPINLPVGGQEQVWTVVGSKEDLNAASGLGQPLG